MFSFVLPWTVLHIIENDASSLPKLHLQGSLAVVEKRRQMHRWFAGRFKMIYIHEHTLQNWSSRWKPHSHCGSEYPSLLNLSFTDHTTEPFNSKILQLLHPHHYEKLSPTTRARDVELEDVDSSLLCYMEIRHKSCFPSVIPPSTIYHYVKQTSNKWKKQSDNLKILAIVTAKALE